MISLRLKQHIVFEKWSKSEGLQREMIKALIKDLQFWAHSEFSCGDNYAKNKAFQNKLTDILQLKTGITDMITGCKKNF